MLKLLNMAARLCTVFAVNYTISRIAAGFGNHPEAIAALILGGADPLLANKMGVPARDEASGVCQNVYMFAEKNVSDIVKLHPSLSAIKPKKLMLGCK